MAKESIDHLSSLPDDVFTRIFHYSELVPLTMFGMTSNHNRVLFLKNYPLTFPCSPQEENAVRAKFKLNPFLETKDIPDWNEKLISYRSEKINNFGSFFKNKKQMNDLYFVPLNESYYQFFLFVKKCENSEFTSTTLEKLLKWYLDEVKVLEKQHQLTLVQTDFLIQTRGSSCSAREDYVEKIKTISEPLLKNLTVFANACNNISALKPGLTTYFFPQVILNDHIADVTHWTDDHFRLLAKRVSSLGANIEKEMKLISPLSHSEVLLSLYSKLSKDDFDKMNIWQCKLFGEFGNQYVFPFVLKNQIIEYGSSIQDERVYNYVRQRMLNEKSDDFKNILQSLKIFEQDAQKSVEQKTQLSLNTLKIN